MDETVKEFLIESNENLNQLDRDLVALESAPDDRQRLSAIFRTIHTIKGTCGFLAFSNLEKVAHAGENLLSKLRDGALKLTPEITSGLLEMVDVVREILASIEQSEQEGERDDSSLIEKLLLLQQPQSSVTTAESPRPRQEPAVEKAVKPEAVPEPAPVAAAPASGDLLGLVERMVREQIAGAMQRQREGDTRPLDEILSNPMVADSKEAADPLQNQRDAIGTSVASSNIRVDVAQLDKLMNLVGELVLARNQILQFSATQQDGIFLSTAQRLNLVTTELQEGIMKTRMQPISNVWNKFPRVVRDLAVACGKQVEVEMEGKETELDKTLIEAIKDPLTHVIRNSVDHGIESPEKRVAAGKLATGKLLLRAFHEGGQVNIEVTDDGAGIDIDRVKRKAVERGLISPQKSAQMSEREALDLLFLPGFSTAQKVTKVSGRGVGMDVLRTNIEKIGGSVDIQTNLGAGTTIRIKIPLTLAIIPALMFTSGGDRYAIPQVSLLELVRLEGEQARKGIEMIHGAPVYRLRGRLLPLVSLSSELKLNDAPSTSNTSASPDARASNSSAAENGVVNIVVLQADGQQFGLIVDQINDSEEIVVKPLGKHLKGITVFAGATILGDGRVALILDVVGLAQQAKVISKTREHGLLEKSEASAARSGQMETLLLMLGTNGSRLAIPLSRVSRLEEFQATSVERSGNQAVVQYRTEIMPLVSAAQILSERRSKRRDGNALAFAETTKEKLPVVVLHAESGQVVGFSVEQILDIVDVELAIKRDASRTGTLGSAVIQGHVTELLDVDAVIRAASARREKNQSHRPTEELAHVSA
jgi:two-component system, chemotaxis family, sensor kinase CheA